MIKKMIVKRNVKVIDMQLIPTFVYVIFIYNMKRIFIFLYFLFVSSTAFSQIDEVQSEEEKFVNIFKDERLDLLDKRPAIMAKAELDEKIARLKDAKAEAAEKVTPLYKPIMSADGKSKVVGSITSAKGFRVVIYNGADRTKAMEIKNAFARAFPGTRSYMSYNVPSYKIKVGDFDDKKDATSFLKRVNGSFPASFIVPDIVTIKNISITH
jgi:hypothetical protein